MLILRLFHWHSFWCAELNPTKFFFYTNKTNLIKNLFQKRKWKYFQQLLKLSKTNLFTWSNFQWLILRCTYSKIHYHCFLSWIWIQHFITSVEQKWNYFNWIGFKAHNTGLLYMTIYQEVITMSVRKRC